jgi:hypothetical protein
MMAAARLLERLAGVRQTGEGRWLARCPAHEDRRASLSVRELDDGRVLVHDFAGCSVEAVLSATGLEFADLFPPRPMEHAPRARQAYPAVDVLNAIADEAAVVALIAGDLQRRRRVSPQDLERLRVAAERIRAARELAIGRAG